MPGTLDAGDGEGLRGSGVFRRDDFALSTASLSAEVRMDFCGLVPTGVTSRVGLFDVGTFDVIVAGVRGRSPILQSMVGAVTPYKLDFQIITNSSAPPEAKKFPSVENSAALTGPA